MKHLEENIRENLCNLGVNKYILDRTQRAQIIKGKMIKFQKCKTAA